MKVAGVLITHPKRRVFRELTKHELASFYQKYSREYLPHAFSRPLVQVRCPRGTSDPCFYQKHPMKSVPQPVWVLPVREKDKIQKYLYIETIEGLIALVQNGAIEFHLMSCRKEDLTHPDRLVLDLDPDPSIPWKEVVNLAVILREALEKLGLQTFVKTTGGKGLHLVAPLKPTVTFEGLLEWTREWVRSAVDAAPERITASSSQAQRKGKIYIDYLRNARGASWVMPFSVRAKGNAPISFPLDWRQLKKVPSSDFFTVHNLDSRLEKFDLRGWTEFFEVEQCLSDQILEQSRDLRFLREFLWKRSKSVPLKHRPSPASRVS